MNIAVKNTPDARETMLKEIGDISTIKIFNNQVLVQVYIRPKVSAGGIHFADIKGGMRDEDKYQGKVGLVIAAGPSAFVDETEKWFSAGDIKVGDWVFFSASDGWMLTVNGVLCRMMTDTHIKGTVDRPDRIY